MRRLLSVLGAAVLVAVGGAPVLAQSPAPIGHWRSQTSSAQLVVQPNGFCSFYGYKPVHGNCSWNSTHAGGILTISYPMPLEPGKLRFSIIWVNPRAITVMGEPFVRWQ